MWAILVGILSALRPGVSVGSEPRSATPQSPLHLGVLCDFHAT